jgi:phosphatidylserine/phosphatidylglycerophosphate/cardiolipin synthase-like enzyme
VGYNNGKNIFHKKVVVFEREKKPAYTVIGSYNWGGKSHVDYEMMVVIKSDKIAKETLTILKEDKKKSKPITADQIEDYKSQTVRQLVGKIQTTVYGLVVG